MEKSIKDAALWHFILYPGRGCSAYPGNAGWGVEVHPEQDPNKLSDNIQLPKWELVGAFFPPNIMFV